MRSSIAILQITRVDAPDRFLGLPSKIPRSKQQVFKLLKEWIVNKTVEWKEHLLSKGGKEVIIKSVASAILVYTMSCFRLPSALCNSINSILANFWREQNQNERKLH